MPRSDFAGTVNGMSLSWIFTIISIAISMGIAIFELNLIISTMSQGISGNTPVLVMYGENANRFLSFFAAFGSVMLPVSFADYFKDSLSDLPMLAVQGLIAGALLLFIVGFFGFSSIRRELKSKLTSRVALIFVTGFGYFLSVELFLQHEQILVFPSLLHFLADSGDVSPFLLAELGHASLLVECPTVGCFLRRVHWDNLSD